MTIQRIPFLFCIFCLIACNEPASKTNVGTEKNISSKPPMGWNSWDCFGTSVTEAEVKSNAEYMAMHLKRFGWEYIVIDIDWYGPNLSPYDTSATYYKNPKPIQLIDSFGRVIPAPNKFPSCNNGNFKPMGDWLHERGLKFGLHVMRGIPWQAVEKNTPIQGTNYSAKDIVKLQDGCNWYDGMRGIDFTKPGAQEYYNSLYRLFADWGVDFVKVDDLSFPYYAADIEAIRTAINLTGRKIVFSTSPGSTSFLARAHVQENANLFRVSEDFWDTWPQLKNQFKLCRRWALYQKANHWADLDMLPLGKISIRGEDGQARQTNFTKDEQITMLTLWSIFKSPLMMGGNLPDNDNWTDSILTNEEILLVNQRSKNGRLLILPNNSINTNVDIHSVIQIWQADNMEGNVKYVAMFNLSEKSQIIELKLSDLKFKDNALVRDLWKRKDLGKYKGTVRQQVAAHGAVLLSLK